MYVTCVCLFERLHNRKHFDFTRNSIWPVKLTCLDLILRISWQLLRTLCTHYTSCRLSHVIYHTILHVMPQ